MFGTDLLENGLKIKGKKCEFAQKEVKFLGHVVSREGIATDPSKVAKVRECPEPKCVRDVRSFLGLTNYYRKFILNYSVVAAPMYEATKERVKGTKFSSVWGPDCKLAFEKLESTHDTGSDTSISQISINHLYYSPMQVTTELAMFLSKKMRMVSYE